VNDDDPYCNRAHETEFYERFRRINIDEVWRQCCTDQPRPNEFEPALSDALYFYSPKPGNRVAIPALERSRWYQKLERAAVMMLAELDEVPDAIWWELQNIYEVNSPADVDSILSEENEGLTYGEYATEQLSDQIALFLATIRESQKAYKPSAGRPKQNESLEQTIRDLGTFFERFAGQEPMATYRYDPHEESNHYKGPFMDFLCAVIWSFNGSNLPSNDTLGEAARSAFGLRK